ncbi:MAG: hypothetical protein ABJI22_18770 [Maribacter sp.]
MVKDFLNDSFLIYKKALEHYEINKYFSNPPTQEERSYLQNNSFFRFIKVAMFKLAVLEICKLIGRGRNDHYSLYKTHIKFQKENISKFNSDEQLILLISDLETKEDAVQKLLTLRNKFYAHTDTDRVDPNLFYVEMDEIFNLVFLILNQMCFVYSNNEHKNITVNFKPEKFNLIKNLIEDKNRRRMDIFNQLRLGKEPEI